ncbi:MAG TPA: filamentous hemagglutinin N-terminal domain-containing protein, partial [Povalibacter sp.]|nr:filamentous hemagglutinin N-terminal domain-containing protein [Povalibacter sp.]
MNTNTSRPARKSLGLSAAISAALALAAGAAHADPRGGVVTNGAATISTPNANLTRIDQATNSVSIDWQSFDVGASEQVIFNQPSARAVALNRILTQDPSQILGSINANGRVFLLNPNGIIFGASARVNVGSLVASSLDLSDADVANGRYSFNTAAMQSGAIVNNGQITAASGGSVTLLGGSVINNGLIVADYGSVNLGAGRAATLSFDGDGLVRFQIDAGLLSNGAGAAVDNTGEILAEGGQVLMTARQANDVMARAVNNDGVIRATRIENVGGTIRLVGPEGSVTNSGTLDAAGTNGTGGEVNVLGNRVELTGTAVVDVSGSNGGGTALIGGSFAGADPAVLNAQQTDVQAGAVIRADSTDTGDAGRVAVWSDGATSFDGNISVRALGSSGNGGFAEVSGRETLSINGHALLGAANGTAGTLLLDPGTIHITRDNGSAGPGSPPYTNVRDTWLSGQLDTPGVTLITTANGQSGAQDLIVDPSANVQWTGDGVLELRAGRSLVLSSTSTIKSTVGTGSLVLDASGATGSVAMGGTISLANGTLDVTSGTNITQTGGSITVGGASDFTADGFVLLGQSGNSFGSLGFSGSITDLTLVDSNAVDLTALDISGNLSVITTTGGITQSGPLTVGGTSNFAATGQAVTLTDTGNTFTNGVGVTAGTATVINSGLTQLLASDVGTLNVTAINGNITQLGPVDVTGNARFTVDGGRSITLGNTNNSFGGTIDFIASGGGTLSN